MLILVLGGLQMLMLGLLGEYFARMLDEVRPRPRYIIERISPELVGPVRNDALLLAQSQPPSPPTELRIQATAIRKTGE